MAESLTQGSGTTIKAAVCRAFGAPLSIEEVQLAPPARGEVEVAVAACAICQSDLSYIDGGWGGTLPAVYGHEAAGIVSAVGPDIEGIAPGDRVVVTLIRSCGTCATCDAAQPVACETRFPLDEATPLHASDGAPLVHGMRTGAFAERVVVDQSQVIPLPDDLPLDIAALLGCGVITGYGAVTRNAQLHAGQTAAVIGCGGVGISTVQAARLADPACLVAGDIVAEKLNTALAFGADVAVDTGTPEAAQRMRDANCGRGFDVVFVATGARVAVELGLSILGRNGMLVLLGMPENGIQVPFDPAALAAAGQRIVGSKMGSSNPRVDIPALIELYRQGRFKLAELIDGRFRFDEINDALAASRSGLALRNVIVMDEAALHRSDASTAGDAAERETVSA